MLDDNVVPQVAVEITPKTTKLVWYKRIWFSLQQTPNPAAQFPSAVPPAVEHSEEVKQVPKVVVELADVQAWFGNWTIENSENTSGNKYIR